MSKPKELTQEQAISLIESMHKRFGMGGLSVHEVDTLRKQHYYQEASQNPPVIQGWEGHSRQTTILRDTAVKLVARLTESKMLPQVSAPRKGANIEKQASDCELGMLSILDDVEAATGNSLQSQMAYGLVRDCYAVLHWYLQDDVYDSLADLDYEERDDLDDDDEERKRFTEDDYGEVDGKRREKTKRYRETEDSLLQRRASQRAMCGSPWGIEVLESTQFAFIADKNPIGQFRYGLKIQAVSLIDLFDGQKVDKAKLDVEAAPVDVLPGGTLDTWRPNAQDAETTVMLYQLWSRDYIYEWIKGLPAGSEIEEFRCIKNRQHMVPFALVPANITLSTDPVHKYEPALTSLYRQKPAFDRLYMNYGILAESTAVPRYILVSRDGSLPPLGVEENGHPTLFADHALAAKYAPEGYDVQRLGGDGVGGDFVKFLEWSQQMLMESRPSTGHAEIEGTTKPWTGRMMLSEANIEPGMYADHMMAAARVMVQNMADVNGDEKDGPGEICFYPKGDEAKQKGLVVIKPEQWRGLRYDVSINKTSAVEQVTKMEHGRELLNDPLVGLTPLEFIRDYEGLPNAEEVWADRKAWQMALPVIEALAKSEVTKWAGKQFALTADGAIVDATNRIVTPAEVLQANGIPPTPPPQPMGPQGAQGAIPPGGGAGPANPAIRMPSLPGLPAGPGAPAMNGMVG